MQKRIVVVGGGAAGLMAAGRAAELGVRVVLLEKTSRTGTKLRITGNGRCNLTNDTDLADFMAHLGPNAMFMRNAFARFFAPDLIAFFASLGVPTVTERGRRVFPVSQDARDVVEALRRYNENHDVGVQHMSPAMSIEARNGVVSAVRLRCGTAVEARAIILATGGVSYPKTGSIGDGFRMARELGHTVTPLRPGLVPLVAAEEWVPRLQGLSLRNVRASLFQGDRRVAQEFGEMLFTHYGVSGPIILTLSSLASERLESGPLRLSIDLKPALDDKTLDARLLREFAAGPKSGYHALLKRLLPKSLIDVFAELSGISPDQPLSQFTVDQRRRVRSLLKDLSMSIVATRPIDEAIVTIGGVSTDEIDPRTMESRLVKGLYFAGEIIDVAGETGGYNLQVAFTTGRIAGESAAKALLGSS